MLYSLTYVSQLSAIKVKKSAHVCERYIKTGKTPARTSASRLELKLFSVWGSAKKASCKPSQLLNFFKGQSTNTDQPAPTVTVLMGYTSLLAKIKRGWQVSRRRSLSFITMTKEASLRI